VSIAAPAATVFRWLCQLRVALYTYDLPDNFERRSPPVADPRLEDIATGQRFMQIFRLTAFDLRRSITLETERPDASAPAGGHGDARPHPLRTPFPTGAGDDWRALAAEHFDSTIQLGDDLHRMTVTARPAHPHVCMGNDEQKG
jgi:hypothetical protein